MKKYAGYLVLVFLCLFCISLFFIQEKGVMTSMTVFLVFLIGILFLVCLRLYVLLHQKYSVNIPGESVSAECRFEIQRARLFKRQVAISKVLFTFLKKEDTTEAVHEALKEMLNQFDAGRICIFEFNKEYTNGTCVYEVLKEGMKSVKDIGSMPIDGNGNCLERLKEGEPIIMADISKIFTEARQVREISENSGMDSVIILPLTSIEDVWGCVMIELAGEEGTWDYEDIHWMISIVNIIDISIQRRRLIENANDKQRYFSWLLSAIPAGIELYDAQGNLIEVNDKDLEIFGVARKEDLLGINLFKHPLATNGLKEKLHLGETINLAFDYSFDKMDDYYKTQRKGSRALITKIMALRDSQGEIVNYLILVVDNTENRNAQSRIIEFEEFFSLAGDYAKVGYARYNILTEEGYASDSWYQNMGVASDIALKKLFFTGESIHPEDRKLREQFLLDAKVGKAQKFRENLRIERGDGKYSWTCDQILVRDYRPQEDVVELVCINYDITELKEMETKLIEAKNQAETLEKLKGAFLANMSHEIRTPLNAIVGFADLLVTTDDPGEKEEYNKIISTNNELLLKLINDILNLSKIEAGFLERNPEKFDFSLYFDELCASIRQRIVRPEVQLVCDNPYPHCVVCLDRNRLAQILLNYATNAIKYTPEGFIKIGYECVDGGLRFYVSDSGIGISEEKKQKVYQRFEKLDEFAQGTGLGLSICKAITETVGGKVGFETEEGKGSTFWSWIPCEIELSGMIGDEIDKKKLDADVYPVARNVGDEGQKKILVAEDIESNFKLLAAILEKDYSLTWVRGGAEAVDKVRSQHFDLILMDMKMPGMNGLEATELIRKIDTETPVIALSAYAFDSDKEAARLAGCNDYLVKPLNKNVLFEIIGRWI